MPASDPSARPGVALVIVGAVLSLAILIAAFRLARSIESWQPPSLPTVIRPRSPLADPPRDSPALATAGPSQILLADGNGHIFLIGIDEEDDPSRLALHRVYQLRHDPSRHMDEPDLKSLSGWYLDDLASERWQRAQAIREKFEDLVASGEPTARVVESLVALARELAEEGEIAYLTERLGDKAYLARRSAGIALGDRGWRRATPVLLEIMRQPDATSRSVAGPILAKLTGIAIPIGAGAEEWESIIGRWEAWWKQNR